MNDRSSPVTPRSPNGRKSVGDVSASSSDYGKKYDGEPVSLINMAAIFPTEATFIHAVCR